MAKLVVIAYLQYAAGVQMVASYARNVLERVSAANERSAKASLAASTLQ